MMPNATHISFFFFFVLFCPANPKRNCVFDTDQEKEEKYEEKYDLDRNEITIIERIQMTSFLVWNIERHFQKPFLESLNQQPPFRTSFADMRKYPLFVGQLF
ncbi:hypothetical protein F5Y07DRAFT_70276 [Xylaria sp. FL0933]|nr:hypothetical protein F5Y07DRAFT_70276 [Xylaria sp. FL0933]